jgi:UDP-3-O-[3-hydroxymyristoyl] glucosamine N-acyltransferase
LTFSLSSADIAKIINGELIGSPNLFFSNLQRIEYSNSKDITFCNNDSYKQYIIDNNPGLVITYNDIDITPKENQAFIKHKSPYYAFAQLLIYLDNQNNSKKGISKSAVIDGKSIIGENPIILDNVVIEEDVVIGNNCYIHQNVVIKSNTKIGDNVVINPGAVIGSDGFGYLDNPDGSYTKIPQLGNVIIGNNVEIGSNTCIDRALVGSTIIDDGVKIDNLVHIAHNVIIGKNSAFAAQVGISGSAKIGERVRMGGQVGSAGHLDIASDVTVIAQSGISKSITQKGIYFGTPAKPRLDAFKIEAVINNLPQLAKEISLIKKKLE